MATIGDLLIKLGIQNEASAGLQEFSHEADKAGEHAESLGTKVGEAKESIVGHLGKIAAAAGLAGAAFEGGEFIKGAIEGAENLKKAQDSLSAAIEHTGGSTAKLMPAFNSTAKAAAKYGITQTDATRGLAQATLITGKASSAQKIYQEALVISKATGMSFTEVVKAAGKAADGQTGALRRYGVMVDSGSTVQQQFNRVMATFGGQAEANTTESEKLNAKFQNIQASLGSLLLPLFDKFIGVLDSVLNFLVGTAKWIGKNADIILPLAAAIGAIVVAMTAWKITTAVWTAVTEIATAAQVAMNAAMDANPIGILILALVALGAALVVLWTRSQTFRDIVMGTWNAIRNTVQAVVDFFTNTVVGAVTGFIAKVQGIFDAVKNWLTSNWKEALLTLFTGLPGLIWIALNTGWGKEFLGKFEDAWNAVKAFVSGVVEDVIGFLAALPGKAWTALNATWQKLFMGPASSAFGAFKTMASGVVDSIVGFFESLPGRLGSAAESAGQAFVSKIESGLAGLGSALTRAIKDPINAVISAWDSIGFDVTLPSVNTHIPGVGKVGGESISFHVPQIPTLAIGTSQVYSDGMAYLHAGEAIVPAHVASGGFNGAGVHIEHMEVRSETDVRLVARELALRLGA